MLTPWEAMRPRICPSLVTLLYTLVVWTFVAAAFFWEPLLLWNLFHGHLGIGHFNGGTLAWGMAVWLGPVFVVEVLALVIDLTTAASKDDREHPESALEPGEFHAAYSITAPLGDYRVRSFDQYREECMEPFWMRVIAVVAVMAWAVAFIFALIFMSPSKNTLTVTPAHLLYGFGAAVLAAWVLVALIMVTATAGAMADPDGSILFLPWKQRWTWVYGLVVLPMAAFYVVAASRLAASNDPEQEASEQPPVHT